METKRENALKNICLFFRTIRITKLEKYIPAMKDRIKELVEDYKVSDVEVEILKSQSTRLYFSIVLFERELNNLTK